MLIINTICIKWTTGNVGGKLFSCYLKLGSHGGNQICHIGQQNLIASDSSPRVRCQSIPTNCPHSVLGFIAFYKMGFSQV